MDLPVATCAVSLGFQLPVEEACPLTSDMCPSGMTGERCDFSLEGCDTGVLGARGECCQSGVASDGGDCCEGPRGEVFLDRAGQCCLGRLDAVGACNGTAKTVTLKGQGCNHVLDAEGSCCPLNRLDEFGVCDGTD